MLGYQHLGRVRLGGWIRFWNPTPVDTALSVNVPWRDTRPESQQVTFPFGLGDRLADQFGAPWNDAQPRPQAVGIPWRQLQPAGDSRSAPWRHTLPRQRAWSVRWRNLQDVSVQAAAPWRNTVPFETSLSVAWHNAAARERGYGLPWRDTEPRTPGWSLPFLHITDFRRSYDIPWQGTRQPPTIWPNPIINDPPAPPEPPEPVYVPPPGDRIGLHLNCRWTEQPGDRLSLPLRRFQCLRRHYVVDNDIIIKRLSDDTEVAALNVRLSGDLESFAFGFTATVPRAGGLDLVNPTDGPVEIEIKVNGQPFHCLVEEFGDGRQWQNGREDTIDISGRSLSAELDEPYRQPKSRSESESRTAFQLMAQELPEGSGWTLQQHPDWTDYTVPGGTFAYSDLTPIRAIALIAQASGAVIQPDPSARVLHIIPRFAGARPWRIGSAMVDVEIDYGIVSAHRARWLTNRDVEPREGIYIEGEKNGQAALCRLEGTAGNWAEPVVDTLITDPQAGLQRGITELGQSWIAAEVGLEIPLKTTGEDATGFVAPGQVVLVTEDPETEWRGISTSWEVGGEWDDTQGLIVRQAIGIERYIIWGGA